VRHYVFPAHPVDYEQLPADLPDE